MSRVDILLPYWGDPKLLIEAVDSVLKQTEPDWHLIIIDDHYPSEEAQQYCKDLDDKRITYIRNNENIGISKNFNLALSMAKSKYCVMMGCDDRMLPDYIETALKNIGKADFYQPGVEVIDANSKIYLPICDKVKKILQPKKSGIYSGEKLATSLCHGNWLYFPSIMWRTETIKKYGFNEKYMIAEDLVLEFSMIIDGSKLHLDNKTTFQYRRFADSLSSREKSKNGVRFNEESDAYNQFAEKFKNMGWKKASRAAKLRITSRINKLIN